MLRKTLKISCSINLCQPLFVLQFVTNIHPAKMYGCIHFSVPAVKLNGTFEASLKLGAKDGVTLSLKILKETGLFF